MYGVNDEILLSSKPQSLPEDTYKGDLEDIMGDTNYQSDEISETDIEKAQDEVREGIRPKSKLDAEDHHVLQVYNKP